MTKIAMMFSWRPVFTTVCFGCPLELAELGVTVGVGVRVGLGVGVLVGVRVMTTLLLPLAVFSTVIGQIVLPTESL